MTAIRRSQKTRRERGMQSMGWFYNSPFRQPSKYWWSCSVCGRTYMTRREATYCRHGKHWWSR